MPIRMRLIACIAIALPALGRAQALDPSTYSLTAAAAEKFVRATQQMVSSGATPQIQGGPNVDLAKVKAALDQSEPANKALATAGLTSADYVLFVGAAMQSAMVGQMEAAGMKNMLPPGVTKRPPQGNIDFMKTNMDIFQRSMTPGAPAASAAAPRATASTSDEALPMPADAGSVLPSQLLAQLPALSTINAKTDCKLAMLTATIQRETKKATDFQAAYYGNPGESGLARTPAEGAVLERAGDSDLIMCGAPTKVYTMSPAWDAAAKRNRDEISNIGTEQTNAINACPGVPGGKDPACERAALATGARKTDAAEKRYLAEATPLFNDWINTIQMCELKREAIVKDAKTANVKGANVKLVLRPLVMAWEPVSYVTSRWTGVCEDAQRHLLKQ